MINKKDLFELTKLSKFEVSDSEAESFCKEMNEIVDFINLSQCACEGESALSEDKLSFRYDEPEESVNRRFTENLSVCENGYFAIRREGTEHE